MSVEGPVVDADPDSASVRLPASATAWTHRPHLDGLRTLAVYSVVAYHGGLAIAGTGYVGVDLFFVLSGYLVTMVLLGDLSNHGRLRLRRFYARRARRLIPAAAVVVVTTALVALLVLPLLERSRLIADARAGSLWFANWHFVAEANDYFAAGGPESPFIHFWSLSIEEQFYLVFPVVLLAAWKVRPGLTSLATVSALFCGASLAAQLVIGSSNANRAYLGTDTRVYQILGGSLLALLAWKVDLKKVVPRLAGLFLGVVGIASFVWLVTGSGSMSTSTRGVAAFVASLAMLVGLESSGGGPLRRVFSFELPQYLGRISYGTYLWHWPVLIFGRSLLNMSPLAATFLAVTVGTALAALSAEIVELPIRRAKGWDRRPAMVIAGGALIAAVSGLVVAPALLDAERQPVVIAAGGAVVEAGEGTPVPALDWQGIEADRPELPTCEQADGADCIITSGQNGTVLLLGDSHARMLIPPLMRVAEQRGLTLAVDYSASCPWQRDLLPQDPEYRFAASCANDREVSYNSRIAALQPDVIIAAGYPRSTSDYQGAHSTNPAYDGLELSALFEATTLNSIDELTDLSPQVVVIEPVPILGINQLSCLSGAALVEECTSPSRSEGLEEELLRQVAAVDSGVDTVDLDPIICPAAQACGAILDDIVVRRDAHHITSDFALTLVPVFDAVLDRALDL